MARAETNIVNEIMKDASKAGARLFRNVRGGMYPIAVIKPLIGALIRKQWAVAATIARNIHPIMAGLLAPGASDLVGYRPIIITPEMVGQTIAVFTVVEVKTDDGRPSPEQLHFIEVVQKSGGFAGVARSPEESRKIMKINS